MRDPQAWGKALLRITLGIIFVMHGYLHWTRGAPAAAKTITQMGFPSEFSATLAWYLIIVHVAGGALMVIGFWTRLAAFLQLPIMLAAVALLHARQGFDKLEYPLLVLIGALAVVLLGPGTLAIDKAAGSGGSRRRGA
jgi:putative oxidoreductase